MIDWLHRAYRIIRGQLHTMYPFNWIIHSKVPALPLHTSKFRLIRYIEIFIVWEECSIFTICWDYFSKKILKFSTKCVIFIFPVDIEFGSCICCKGWHQSTFHHRCHRSIWYTCFQYQCLRFWCLRQMPYRAMYDWVQFTNFGYFNQK